MSILRSDSALDCFQGPDRAGDRDTSLHNIVRSQDVGGYPIRDCTRPR